MQPVLKSIQIKGYRPFGDLVAPLGRLEVFVGANGVGKSSLFEFLKFLRDGVHEEIPPEIVPGSAGQQLFHRPGPLRLGWRLDVEDGGERALHYRGELLGPVGQPQISLEEAQTASDAAPPLPCLDVRGGQGFFRELAVDGHKEQPVLLKRGNQLALSLATNPEFRTLYQLREYIRSWRFYSSFNLAQEKIRQPVLIEQDPLLREDAGNLSSVLHDLYTSYPAIFDELQHHLRSVVPGFRALSVKARGGPGQVIAFWQEDGVEGNLSLADLSDGILRLLCWMVLCLQPKPPALICIDEPDQGVHPRTLPLLGGLFEKASDRTQILLATHASYFLLQFGLERIAVLRKEDGEVKFLKPHDSAALTRNLEDFGPEEIELMHRSDELEQLA